MSENKAHVLGVISRHITYFKDSYFKSYQAFISTASPLDHASLLDPLP